MGEASRSISIFVKVSQQKTFVKEVFLFENHKRNYWGLFSAFFDKKNIAFLYEID